jgi:deferrochelatase/peroxidase EfeB
MDKIIKRSSGDEIITLDKGWTSEDGAYFDTEKIEIKMSAKTKLSLVNAQQVCGLNEDYWAIEVRSNDDIRYLGENGDEDPDFRADVEYYRVTSDSIVFHAQHKHNSSAQIESEMFNIK